MTLRKVAKIAVTAKICGGDGRGPGLKPGGTRGGNRVPGRINGSIDGTKDGCSVTASARLPSTKITRRKVVLGRWAGQVAKSSRMRASPRRRRTSLPTIWWERAQVPWLGDRTVTLTFDDGPNVSGATTARLLETLARAGVQAAFCVTGYAAERAPELVRRVRDDGHLLANHTYGHRVESLLRTRDLNDEIRRCDEAIGRALGDENHRSRWFRPPYGWVTPAVRTCAAARGLRVLPITHFAFDTWCTRRGAPGLVKAHVRVARRDGAGIFVIHDGLVRFRPFDRTCDLLPGNDRSWVPGAVGSLIARLRAEGFGFALPPAG